MSRTLFLLGGFFSAVLIQASILFAEDTYRIHCDRNPESAKRIAMATRERVRSQIDDTVYKHVSVRVRLRRVENPASPASRTVDQVLNGLTLRRGNGGNSLTFALTGTPQFETSCTYRYAVSIRVHARKRSDNSRIIQTGTSEISITSEMDGAFRSVPAPTATPTPGPIS